MVMMSFILIQFVFFSTILFLSNVICGSISEIGFVSQSLGFIFLLLIFSTHISILLLVFLPKLSPPKPKTVNSDKKAILVTGCDTGFGHDIALKLNESGFTVFAGCLFSQGQNAQSLLEKCLDKHKMHVLQFNVTKKVDINNIYSYIHLHLTESDEIFYGLVNNAGIAGFSLLEWGSFQQDIEPIVKVNLEAMVNVTKKMLPP